MPLDSIQAVAVTIRPKDGITNEQILAYNKWAVRTSSYSYTVTEKEGTERHLHSALYFDKGKKLANVRRSILNLFPDLTNSEKIVAGQGIKPIYDIHWHDYLQKGDYTEVIHSHLPEAGKLEAYFPEREGKAKTCKKLSYYMKLEKLHLEHVGPGHPVEPANIRDFLFDMMYNKRLIDVIRDDKTIIQTSRHLSRYIKRMSESCIEVNSLYERDE